MSEHFDMRVSKPYKSTSYRPGTQLLNAKNGTSIRSSPRRCPLKVISVDGQ